MLEIHAEAKKGAYAEAEKILVQEHNYKALQKLAKLRELENTSNSQEI